MVGMVGVVRGRSGAACTPCARLGPTGNVASPHAPVNGPGSACYEPIRCPAQAIVAAIVARDLKGYVWSWQKNGEMPCYLQPETLTEEAPCGFRPDRASIWSTAAFRTQTRRPCPSRIPPATPGSATTCSSFAERVSPSGDRSRRPHVRSPLPRRRRWYDLDNCGLAAILCPEPQ
jgi:hypothetical protein